MWATWPAIVVLGFLGVVGSFRVYKQARLWLDARTWSETEANRHDRQHYAWAAGTEGQRPRVWAIVLPAIIVFGLVAAAIALLVVAAVRS